MKHVRASLRFQFSFLLSIDKVVYTISGLLDPPSRPHRRRSHPRAAMSDDGSNYALFALGRVYMPLTFPTGGCWCVRCDRRLCKEGPRLECKYIFFIWSTRIRNFAFKTQQHVHRVMRIENEGHASRLALTRCAEEFGGTQMKSTHRAPRHGSLRASKTYYSRTQSTAATNIHFSHNV